jgi:hypothetical protein
VVVDAEAVVRKTPWLGCTDPQPQIPWLGCTDPQPLPSGHCAELAVGLALSPFVASSGLVERLLR